MQKSKIESYIGFAIKARKVIFGYNAILLAKTKKYLFICCNTASHNTIDKIIKLAHKEKCILAMLYQGSLEQITGKINCKVLAISDKNFAVALQAAFNEQLNVFDGGSI